MSNVMKTLALSTAVLSASVFAGDVFDTPKKPVDELSVTGLVGTDVTWRGLSLSDNGGFLGFNISGQGKNDLFLDLTVTTADVDARTATTGAFRRDLDYFGRVTLGWKPDWNVGESSTGVYNWSWNPTFGLTYFELGGNDFPEISASFSGKTDSIDLYGGIHYANKYLGIYDSSYGVKFGGYGKLATAWYVDAGVGWEDGGDLDSHTSYQLGFTYKSDNKWSLRLAGVGVSGGDDYRDSVTDDRLTATFKVDF